MIQIDICIFLKNQTLQFEQSVIIIFIIVRNYKYSDLIFLHGIIKYDNWLYKNLKKILIEILFHILNIYYKKIHIFSMHREFK